MATSMSLKDKANLKRDINSKWQHDMFEVMEKQIAEMELKSKWRNKIRRGAELFLRNLHHNVLESDIFDLFSMIGRLLSVHIDYDQSGRSLGTAKVFFEHQANAIEAMKQYKGLPLDGKSLEIELVKYPLTSTGDMAKIRKASLVATVKCRFYPKCNRTNCKYYHPKPCRYGKNCTNKNCNYYHLEIIQIPEAQVPLVTSSIGNKFEWVSPSISN